MLSYRMTATQTEAFNRGGPAATQVATAIAETLRVLTEQAVVVVDHQGLIAFLVEPSGGGQ
jgi:hypothetical protein